MKTTKKFVQEWQAYNSRMKRIGCPTKTLEEYKEYRSGNKKRSYDTKDNYKPNYSYRKNDVESLDSRVSQATLTKEKIYTGNTIKGLITVNKSNAIPVLNDKAALLLSET